jgi:hypothetical protein
LRQEIQNIKIAFLIYRTDFQSKFIVYYFDNLFRAKNDDSADHGQVHSLVPEEVPWVAATGIQYWDCGIVAEAVKAIH